MGGSIVIRVVDETPGKRWAIMQNKLKKFEIAIGTAKNADSAWMALEDFSKAAVGDRLFTVMTFDMTAGFARRSYSDQPMEYPVSGTKPITDGSGLGIMSATSARTVSDVQGGPMYGFLRVAVELPVFDQFKIKVGRAKFYLGLWDHR